MKFSAITLLVVASASLAIRVSAQAMSDSNGPIKLDFTNMKSYTRVQIRNYNGGAADLAGTSSVDTTPIQILPPVEDEGAQLVGGVFAALTVGNALIFFSSTFVQWDLNAQTTEGQYMIQNSFTDTYMGITLAGTASSQVSGRTNQATWVFVPVGSPTDKSGTKY
uniref:Uncharacterized protein n=1 Tax=Mycena chlorophos TaxID=658473 RepID=A0ABQ0L3E2_MYCCL|nr:predicted protein [Mycena chlorophos]